MSIMSIVQGGDSVQQKQGGRATADLWDLVADLERSGVCVAATDGRHPPDAFDGRVGSEAEGVFRHLPRQDKPGAIKASPPGGHLKRTSTRLRDG